MNTKILLSGVGVIVVVTALLYVFVSPMVTSNMSGDYTNTTMEPIDEKETEEVVVEEPSVTIEPEPKAETEEVVVEEVVAPEVIVAPKPVVKEIEPTPTATGFTMSQVAMHPDKTSCWTAVNEEVYDLTPFIKRHPGGSSNILKICGKDGTSAFERQHGGDSKPENTLTEFYIGQLQ